MVIDVLERDDLPFPRSDWTVRRTCSARRWCQTEVPNRWVASSSKPLSPAAPSSPTTGARLSSYCRCGTWRRARCRDLPAHHSPRVLQSQNMATWHSPRRQPQHLQPISTNSRSASIAATTHTTLSAPCLALLATSLRGPLHLVVGCDNQISTVFRSAQRNC